MSEKKRHIELAVVKVEWEHVTFQIAEQTHMGTNFSPDGAIFVAKNGLRLASGYKDLFNCKAIFVRSDNEEFDDANISCTVYEFAKIMEAVNEYNETDGWGYDKPWKYFCIKSTGHICNTNYDNHPIDNDRR